MTTVGQWGIHGTGGPRTASHDLAPAFCFRLGFSKVLQLFPEQGRVHYLRHLWAISWAGQYGCHGLWFIQSWLLSYLWWCISVILALRKLGQMDHCKSESARGIKSLQTAWDTQWDTILKNPNKWNQIKAIFSSLQLGLPSQGGSTWKL